MKLATYNLNGIRARLPRLLEWLEREKPDVVCLQELKCADESLPIADIEAAGYGAVWHGQKGFNGVAVLARGDTPELRRVGLPGDPDDTHSRYIEAEVRRASSSARSTCPTAIRSAPRSSTIRSAGWSGCRAHAAELLEDERPAVLCGDWNVVPEDRDVFSVRATQHDAVMQPEARQVWRRIVHQGWTDALARLPSERGEALHLLGLYGRLLAARSRVPPRSSAVLARSGGPPARRRRRPAGRGARRKPPTTRRPGSS